MYHYSHAVLGGTFDRLHKGHKAFLHFALSVSEHLYIGITSDEYVKKHKHVSDSLSYSDRKKELETFFKEQNASKRVTLTEIHVNAIPDELQKKADAIVVTLDTLPGAEVLNSVRKEKNLSPLPVVTFSNLLMGTDGHTISSTSIRRGEIDRNGEFYLTKEMRTHTFFLPPSLRQKLKDPLGEVMRTEEIFPFPKNDTPLVTVGDVTTRTFLENGITPSLSVVDLYVQRKKTYTSLKELGFSGSEYVYHIENPKSHIVPSVFMMLSYMLQAGKKRSENSVLQITGEEDLIVLPIILLAPLGARVFYGQPGKGIVQVLATEEMKQTMRSLLNQFTKTKPNVSH